MFCILHQYCPKAGDNGHCTVYEDVRWRNRRGGFCSIATTPEQKLDMAKHGKKKVINALKESKRKAAGA
jgi:hypothetical protein